jgi:hypothetical protein
MNDFHGKNKSVPLIPKDIFKNKHTLSADKSFVFNLEGSSP